VKTKLLICLLLLAGIWSRAQENDSTAVDKKEEVEVAADQLIRQPYDPLAPSKAAFYSAVLPGLGQVYNKKYWKIPIIYAGMATGIYFYIQNNNDYNRFRDAYKRRLAGFTDDEFYGPGENPVISNDRLIDAQKSAQRNRNISILVAIGFYALNIVDANVDAHLRQYNVSEDLSLQPNVSIDPINARPNYSLSLTFDIE
jgi:hypothetical protein